jgi:hypothetical protein
MKRPSPILTAAEAALLVQAKKTTVRPMEWVPKKSPSNPRWLEFVSVCKIESEIREDLYFRSQYRAARTEVSGAANIEYAAIYNAAITAGGERIVALDADDTPHTNKVGRGMEWYRKTLRGRYHFHRWCDEGYGYAEPVDEDLHDIELLVDHFLVLANLALIDGFTHPLKGAQLALPI